MKRTRLKPISKRKLAELAKWRAVRDEVLRAADGVCQRCGTQKPFWHVLHAHHRCPRSVGGKDTKGNLVALCWRCHRTVHDHTVPDWRKWLWRSTSSSKN